VQPGGDLLDAGSPDEPGRVTFELDGGKGSPSRTILIVLLLTVMSLAPALLVLMTSFTRIIIVLSLTRNALGVQAIPPNQVLVGLSLFLSLFIMGPTLSEVNEQGLQPMIKGDKEYAQAYEDGIQPLRTFMLKEVKEKELALFVKAAGDERPTVKEDVSMSALVPAFVLSEIKTAFLIGFIIFIPFLVIDIVVSSSLMSMGMMMLPPVLISLPFKLLLFVMVDGWALIVRSLLASYQ
jgi:flagellar biosynthetic protein FliP